MGVEVGARVYIPVHYTQKCTTNEFNFLIALYESQEKMRFGNKCVLGFPKRSDFGVPNQPKLDIDRGNATLSSVRYERRLFEYLPRLLLSYILVFLWCVVGCFMSNTGLA